MNLTGTIKKIGETQTFGSNGFAKRELWLTTTDGQYEQNICIEFHQDNVDYLDNKKVGEEVKCSLNLRGKIWENPNGEDRCFNSLVCWRIENANANSTTTKYTITTRGK